MASKKLCSYFLAHKLVAYTDQPLKQPFSKYEVCGRMLKWFIELNVFDISYEPRKAIKGQAFADFHEKRKYDVDGICRRIFTQNWRGAGIIFRGRHLWVCTISKCVRRQDPKRYSLSDSQLIVSQMNGEYEARDLSKMKYMNVFLRELEHLKSFEVRQIPGSEKSK